MGFKLAGAVAVGSFTRRSFSEGGQCAAFLFLERL